MVSLSDIEYEKMKCDIQNLENENATLKAQLSVVTEWLMKQLMVITSLFQNSLRRLNKMAKRIGADDFKEVVLAILETDLDNEECAEIITFIADGYFERTDE